MDEQKTLDTQTAKFIATICQHLPALDRDVMQVWIENPRALKKVLADTLCPPSEKIPNIWREEDGIIYFSVTSDGTSGKKWIKRLERNGFRLGDGAKQILCSPDFSPTSGVKTEVAILKGDLFVDNDRVTQFIHAEADRRRLIKPSTELACLIREKLSEKMIGTMGLQCIVNMHEPIKKLGTGPSLLIICRDDGDDWLYTNYDSRGDHWDRRSGFAYVISSTPTAS